MSIRLRISLAVAALALAACNGGTQPDVNPTAAPTAIPTGTAATVIARYQGNLLYNQPIVLWTNGGTATAPAPGTQIATVNTDPSSLPTGGEAIFSGLTPGTMYCWTYDYVLPTPPGNAYTTYCTDAWSYGFTLGS
jgi:hypothetical protein